MIIEIGEHGTSGEEVSDPDANGYAEHDYLPELET